MGKPKPAPSWWIYSGVNTSAPTPVTGGFSINIPNVPSAATFASTDVDRWIRLNLGYVGYVLKEQTPTTALRLAITLRIERSTPPPVFDYWTSEPANSPGAGDPASASAIIWRKNTGGSCRWWSVDRIWLDAATATTDHTIEIPLTAAAWFTSDSYGTFADALRETWAVGLTFGGGNFRGHGVGLDGGACKFTCTQFQFLT